MKITELSIPGCYLIEHRVFPDERGSFREWFKGEEFSELVPGFQVQQANLSRSHRGVIRGIHYSLAPGGQAKLVTCAQGEIIDVLVDLRVDSDAFGRVESVPLKSDSGSTVFLASGVGHAFASKAGENTVVYLTSSKYAPTFEKSITPLDETLNIDWESFQTGEKIISPADLTSPSFEQAKTSFQLPMFNHP